MATLEEIRHSLAHLLAAVVLKKYPKTKLGIGPVIENGFYYDFKFPRPINETDLKQLEVEIRQLIKKGLDFRKEKLTALKAKKIFKNQPFKLDLIKELIKEKTPLYVYNTGNIFTDLCRGGHVRNTKEINPEAFKLTHLAGAYWRGNEKNSMLTRIYGLAFNAKQELDKHLQLLEEAKKRDHRKIGKELGLFTFNDYVGPGLPLWMPKGTIIIEELEKLAKETERKSGYQQIRTPHIAKEIMYKISGHLPYYSESMFPPMTLKEENGSKETYYLRAMNCPHHHQIYAAEPRSYRDLPLRFSEYGAVYRYEKSGELFGLMRVRMLNMNDAHIYCAENQFESEFQAVNKMYLDYFKLFGLKKYEMRFSTHDPKELGKKYVNEPKLWEKTENMVRKVLVDNGINFTEAPNEAAFYGPKIDVQVWSSIGREFTIATNQVDFAVPARFNLAYTDKDGQTKTPIVIHRAPLGTHERFIGFLIEHYGGAFPLWLAPIQVAIIPVSEKHNEYAQSIAAKMFKFRVRISDENETLGKKIRNTEIQKIPYSLIVGDKEEKQNNVNVRHYKTGILGALPLEKLMGKIKKEIKERKYFTAPF